MHAKPMFLCLLASLSLSWLRDASSAVAEREQYRVIVNPHNEIVAIDREFLRDAYLKKQTEWPPGRPGGAIRPVSLSRKFAAHDQFARGVIQKTPAQLKTYWNQQIFSGKGIPPPEVDTTDDVIAYVLANPGAIGYLPAHVPPGAAKLIEVR
jgi:ABC-type phosphate transport system substrate-binding protein